MKVAGIEWDEGNWPKCAKHGLTKAEIQEALQGAIVVFNDPFDAKREERMRAIGRNHKGRYIFLVYCHRWRGKELWLRPISARYMHKKEIDAYV